MPEHEIAKLTALLEAHGRMLLSIQTDQRDLMHLLKGNPIDPGDHGLLGRIEDMEGEISTVKTELQKHREFGQKVIFVFSGGFAVLSFIVGIVAWAAKLFIK